MSGNEKRKAKASGWVIPGRPLFGTTYASLRAEMQAAKIAWDATDAVWLCPTKELYDSFITRCPPECRQAAPEFRGEQNSLPAPAAPVQLTQPVLAQPAPVQLPPPQPSAVVPVLPPSILPAPIQVLPPPVACLPPPAVLPPPMLDIVAPPPPDVAVERPAEPVQVQPVEPAPAVQVQAPVQPVQVQAQQVQQPTSAQAEAKRMALGFTEDRSVLRLEPARYAIISIPIEPKGWQRPRRRRELERQVELLQVPNGGTGDSFEAAAALATDGSNGQTSTTIDASLVTIKAQKLTMKPEEEKAARKLQSQLGYSLRRLGTRISDGIIVFPLKNEGAFDDERTECKRLARIFNEKSTHYEIRVAAIKLEAVVSDEEQIARQVAYECQRLMADLRSAMFSLDVPRIRELTAAAKYKASALAAGTAQGALYAAVAAARQTATKIAKDMVEKSVTIEEIKRSINFAPVDSARFTFLEYEIPSEIAASPSIENGRFENLGEENPEVEVKASSANPARDLELQ
jgi:hypothetical protein